MKYNLSDYKVTITCANSSVQSLIGDLVIGGQGSSLDSISIEYENNMWSTASYASGGFVHNKNCAKNGAVSMTINQLSNSVARLFTLCNLYYNESIGDPMLTISVTDRNGRDAATAYECLPIKIPAQEFGATAGNQSWSFTSGKIVFGSAS